MVTHFNIISKTKIAVILCESTISCMLVCQPAQLACSNLEVRQTQLTGFWWFKPILQNGFKMYFNWCRLCKWYWPTIHLTFLSATKVSALSHCNTTLKGYSENNGTCTRALNVVIAILRDVKVLSRNIFNKMQNRSPPNGGSNVTGFYT